MRRYFSLLFSFVALAGAGAVHAQATICKHGILVGDDHIGRGVGCVITQSTQPEDDTPGGQAELPQNTTPPVLPSWISADLIGHYAEGQTNGIEFELDFEQLNLDGKKGGAHLDLFELALLGKGGSETAPESHHFIAIAIDRDLTAGTTVRVDWQTAPESGTEGVAPVPMTFHSDSVKFEPDETKVWVRIRPAGNLWDEPEVVVESLVNEFSFTSSSSFEGLTAVDGRKVRPWYLRAGIISGDLQYVGMTSKFTFFGPTLMQ